MLASDNSRNLPKRAPIIYSVHVKVLPENHSLSASIEAIKYYCALNDKEAAEGLADLPFMCYATTTRDMSIAVVNDLENFGFRCHTKHE